MPFNNLPVLRTQINKPTPWANPECNKCRDEEAHKPKSTWYRAAGLNVIPSGLPDTKTAWLDIQADNTCNGGCLICGPWSSSHWQSELAKFGEFKLAKTKEIFKHSVDRIFNQIDVSELRFVHFLGGEPFLSDVDSHALPRIPNPSICDIRYTTNGSVYPTADRLALWEPFKSVIINLSIDGVGPRFEYLRYPLNWNKVDSNISRFINETNVRFQINHTVTPFNIFYHQEFLDWVDKTFPKERLGNIHVHTAYGVMSVKNCNNKLRQMVIDKYGEGHTLSKMLRDSPEIVSTDFWNYIDKWDQRRSQSWKTCFPELVGIIDR